MLHLPLYESLDVSIPNKVSHIDNLYISNNTSDLTYLMPS